MGEISSSTLEGVKALVGIKNERMGSLVGANATESARLVLNGQGGKLIKGASKSQTTTRPMVHQLNHSFGVSRSVDFAQGTHTNDAGFSPSNKVPTPLLMSSYSIPTYFQSMVVNMGQIRSMSAEPEMQQVLLDAYGQIAVISQSKFVSEQIVHGDLGLSEVALAAGSPAITGAYAIPAGDVFAANAVYAGAHNVRLNPLEFAEATFTDASAMRIEFVDKTSTVASYGAVIHKAEVLEIDVQSGVLVVKFDTVPASQATLESKVVFREGFSNASIAGLERITAHLSGRLFGIDSDKNQAYRVKRYDATSQAPSLALFMKAIGTFDSSLSKYSCLTLNASVFAQMLPDYNTIKDSIISPTIKQPGMLMPEGKEELQAGVRVFKFVLGDKVLYVQPTSHVKRSFVRLVPCTPEDMADSDRSLLAPIKIIGDSLGRFQSSDMESYIRANEAEVAFDLKEQKDSSVISKGLTPRNWLVSDPSTPSVAVGNIESAFMLMPDAGLRRIVKFDNLNLE